MAHQSSELARGEQDIGGAGAVTMLLTARIRAEKRAEFLLSARSFGPTGGFEFFEGTDDPEQICAVGRMRASADERYLESDRFRALKGALRTLASEWTLEVLRQREGWCAESQQDR